MNGGYTGIFDKITSFAAEGGGYFTVLSSRKALMILNSVLSFFSVVLAGFGLYLCTLLYDPDFTAGWINWLGLSVVGISLFVVGMIGIRGAYIVSLELLLTYFWGIIVFVAPMFLGLFACFNWYFFIPTWFLHEWSKPGFAQLRKIFCEPASTANNKCIAPLNFAYTEYRGNKFNYTGDYNATVWCLQNFGATDCVRIRNDAIDRAVLWAERLIFVQTCVGVFTVLLISIAIYISYKILTSPVITQSMNDIINYLLLLPIAGALGASANFWWLIEEDVYYNWLPHLYLALGVCQAAFMAIGITAGRLKSRRFLRVYLGAVLLILAGYGIAASSSFTLAKIVREDYTPSE